MLKKKNIVPIILVVLLYPYFSLAAGGVYFGGMVVFTEPCDEGLLLTLAEPGGGSGQFMWNYGELPYLMYTPPHIGQNMIGMAMPGAGVCTIDGEPYGDGALILFHGESN